jgi:NAD(P)-dependent dehydrogenase (short-subunit alcohol dehydrogenase family)
MVLESMALSEKVALLVGSGKGLGQAIASALAKNGADVAVADFEESVARETAKLVNEQGRKSLAMKVDPRSGNEVEDLVRKVVDEFGKIDILVNALSAATSAQYIDTTEDDYDLNMDFNAKGVYLTCKSVSKRMIEQGRGKIINISSMYGKSGGLLLAAYAASKAAVIGFTQCLAVELAEHGICVNAICSGLIERRELELAATLKGMSPSQIEGEGFSASPERNIGEPQDIAKLVVFLASDESNYITGQALNLADDEVTYMRSLTIAK